MTTGFHVGGTGSGKTCPCLRCRKLVEQPASFPSVIKEWCDEKCQAAYERSIGGDWDEADEAASRAEASRFR